GAAAPGCLRLAAGAFVPRAGARVRHLEHADAAADARSGAHGLGPRVAPERRRPPLEPDLAGDRLERIDQEADVLLERPSDRGGAAVDVGAVDRAREGLVLELLHDGLDRQVRDRAARA